MIGVDSGWEIYVAGNGGIKTEVAQFLVKVKTADEVLEYAGAFLQLYREEGWYLERTVHYVARVGLDYVKKKRARRRRGPARAVGAAAVRARRRARSVARARQGAASTLRQFEPLPVLSRTAPTHEGCAGRTMDSRSAASTTSRGSARAASRGAARRRRRGVPHRRRPACSRCSTAARTRAGRCRRASCSASSVACPLHNWTIGLADGCARGARRRLHADASRCKVDDGQVVPRCDELTRSATDGARCAAPIAIASRRRCARRAPPARYCGVGCGVIIEQRRRADHRRARRPGPSGQLRPAVQQGQHAAPDRAAAGARGRRALLQPRCARRRGAARRGASAGTRRSTTLADRFAAIDRDARPGRGRLLHLGPAADRGLLRLQQARQGPDRHQQRRHQLAAVHVAARSPATSRRSAPTRRRPATRTSTTPTASSSPARTPRGRTRSCSAASRTRSARNPALKIDRRRPAPHRDRGDAPTCTCRSCPAPTSRCSTACCTCCCGKAWSTPPTSPRTPSGFDALKRPRARLHAARGGRASAACGEDDIVQAARWFGAGDARDAVAVLPGPEPDVERHRQERRADQPAPGHRPDRQARRRAVLAHRPAQRDGRARGRRPGEPAVRASRPRAIRRTAPRSRALWGVDDVPATPGKTAVEMFEAARRRRDQGAVDRLHQPGAVDARPGRRARARCERCRVRGLQEAFATTATARLRRRAAAGHDLGREGRHRHQLRAPHHAACARRCRRPARRAHDWRIAVDFARRLEARLRPGAAATLFPYDDARSGLERAPRDHARPRPRHHRPVLRAAREQRAAAVAVPGRRGAPAARACTRTALSRRPTAARASPTRRTRRWPSRATRAIRSA